MATRLLVIHKQLVFAVTIKQALEQTGGYAVHPFTKAEAAFDFLRDHPQDIALVDFNLPGRSGSRIIQQLRALQPDIAVIVTPQLSDVDMRNFGVQASLNSPFTARDLLPLLQNVLDEVPSDNLGTAPPPPMGGQMTTSNLGEQKRIKRQQMGTTQNLGDNALTHSNEPSQPHILSSDTEDEADKPQTKELVDNPLKRPRPADQNPEQNNQTNRLTTRPLAEQPPPAPPKVSKADPFKTRNFDDLDLSDLRPPKTKPFVDNEPAPAQNIDRFQTRNLQDDSDSEPKVDTRILPEMPSVPEIDSFGTRRFDSDPTDEDNPPQTRDLGKQQQPAVDQFGTRPLGEAASPPAPPEFSSLDRVLQSFGMDEPPADDMDTPAVPTKDSDALRQFIATNSGDFDAESFDDVLGAIEPDISDTPKKQRQVDFEGLVKSMQRDEPQNRLPDRQQQQLLDFVLTSGMDSVLKEIEKTKTGLLPKVSTPPAAETPPPLKRLATDNSFRKLAAEEPPLPTLEENGTVSDLLVGMADSNFRDVLALLNEAENGDQSQPVVQNKPPTPPVTRQTDSGYFDDFLQSTNPDSDSVPVIKPIRPPLENYDFNFDFNDDDDGATVAGVVLRSTQENTSTPGEFSLDQLMSDINDRLTTHKLKVRPLPSWDMDTTAFHAPVTDIPETPTASSTSRRMAGEPSFLPEMFPPDEIIARELPPLETEAEVAEVWTTQASEPSLEQIESVDADDETMVEPGYFDETVMGEPTTIDADLFSGIMEDSSSIDDEARYDDQAESSDNQFVYDWDEPDNTVEATPVEEDFILPEVETSIEAPAIDDWDTLEAQPEAELPEDFSSFNVEEIPASQEAVADNWDTDWAATDIVPEPELVVENIANEWDMPAEVQDIPPVETYAAALTEEARIAQLALNLTQVSLETSAVGTILTRKNQIIALAGHLSQEDTIELQNTIHNDWGTGGDGARLRFITLPSSNKEYMLYSTGTEDDLILSMIFAGTTPLRIIRQQGQRLVKALGDVPENLPTTTIMPTPIREVQPIEEESLEPNAYVWLVRDPEQPLSSAVAHSISTGLMTQLSEMRWKIEQLQVQDEYIYLLANVPSETPSYAVIRELKQRAATIAQKQDNNLEVQDLWADSYLVLSPGRELAPDEIQEFVDFQRMM